VLPYHADQLGMNKSAHRRFGQVDECVTKRRAADNGFGTRGSRPLKGSQGGLPWTMSADVGHTWELVIDPAANTVLHFNYVSS
jgi:hypothetical protein